MQFSVLLVASGLALLALAYVLYPLYHGRWAKTAAAAHPSMEHAQSSTSDSEQATRLSLQEVELDYQLGNIAEADYRTLRERYMRRALVAMQSRFGNVPTDTEPYVDENGQDTEDTQNIQDGQETDLDALIEEQVRKLRETRKNDGGGKDDE